MGKGPFYCCKSSKRRQKKMVGPSPASPPQLSRGLERPKQLVDGTSNNDNPDSLIAAGPVAKGKKKPGGTRLWMRFDRFGNSELVEFDRSAIVQRAGIPARDLRILGSLFSHSSTILAREKAMVINLEFIRAIVTAEEVLIIDPLGQDVLPFVDQLRQQRPIKMRGTGDLDSSSGGELLSIPQAVGGSDSELPFEFQVLETALEIFCTYFDSTVAELEKDSYPALDELARNVSTNNLEYIRSLKSKLTRLLSRVQKARDEIEHLLDADNDMADLYLTRKWICNQQSKALIGTMASSSITPLPSTPHLSRLGSNRSASSIPGNNDVEDLEMLLEAYFIQLDGIRDKILSVREYIDDTEDYVNIQLDSMRNELIQIQLILSAAAVPIALETMVCGIFSINIPCTIYNVNGIFGYFVGGMVTLGLLIFLFIVGYARWKKLLS